MLTAMAVTAWLKGKTIYSNYDILFSDYFIRSIEQLDSMRNGWFFWDDAYIQASSRRKDVTGSNMILGKSRKRNVHIPWTTTRPMQVDINIRVNTKFLWIPELTFIRHPFKKGKKLPFSLKCHKFKFIPEAKEESEFIGEKVGAPIVIPFDWLIYIMCLYDTEEEIDELD